MLEVFRLCDNGSRDMSRLCYFFAMRSCALVMIITN